VAISDPRGVPLAAGEAASALRLEAAILDMLGFRGDPVGKADAALAHDPELVLAHCLKAHAFAFAQEPRLRPLALAAVTAGETVAGSTHEREGLHLSAARAWAEGDPARSLACFDTLLERYPRDVLALQFAHQADFFTGKQDAFRERPRRVLAALGTDIAGYGFAQGMLAFGLEEAGAYEEAEALGREAVTRSPTDAWAIHAVAHVLEMQGRSGEGIAWYEAREADWAEASFFAVHNAWHLALYHLERDDHPAALAVYDRLLRPGRRSLVLNLCDAAALLWRLHLAGVDAGERWPELAGAMAAKAEPGCHVFNDIHLALALAGAGRLAELEGLTTCLHALALGGSDYAARLRAVALPAIRAAAAFARGGYGEAVILLAPTLPELGAMSGSHAQREILTRTLCEAALRDGQRAIAHDILAAQARCKPGSPRLARELARCSLSAHPEKS
jgi:tetratricopeptide (TPR) repeat protein